LKSKSAVRLIVPLLTAALAGCSLIDGWGGLEGGDAGSRVDAVAADDGGGYDAGGGQDGGDGDDTGATSDGPVGHDAAPPVGASCGGTRCDSSSNQGCCFDTSTGSATCVAAGACGSSSSFFLCDNASECAAFGPQATCCLQIGATTSASCSAGSCLGEPLCSGPGATCPAGKQCVSGAPIVPPGYSICN
jgi:hypothetical protein